MKRNDWKYLIDALLFIDICSIAIIGLVMAFVIPPGQGSEAAKYFMGLHRHEWGDIHLYLSLFLLGLLVLHVWFSWTWVVQSTKSYFGDQWRRALGILSGAWIAVILLAWLLVKLG
jgi:hypothetical protein